MFLLAVLCAAPAALSLPVTQVTVFSDRARVVREAPIVLSGTKVVELPLLPDSVDLDSIRLELSSGTVRLVSVGRGEVGDFAAGEAKDLLQKLEKVDDRIEGVARERSDQLAALRVLQRLRPQVPQGDPLKPQPKLTPQGWTASLQFVDQQGDKLLIMKHPAHHGLMVFKIESARAFLDDFNAMLDKAENKEEK